MESLKLNSGGSIPKVGLGTWKSDPGVVGSAIKAAIDVGVRHIDCAAFYGNEPEIGTAIAEKISEGKVKREDLFITGKLWNQYHNPGSVKKHLLQTLKDLQTPFLDLYLIHWPLATKETAEMGMPKDENGVHLLADDDYVDTWKAMEEVYKEGLTKSIGISNFNSKQIKRLLENATVKPSTMQVESHPFFNNRRVIEFSQQNGIPITAFSPFAYPDRTNITADAPRVFQNKVLKEIAERNGRSIAQIVLRWLVQRGCVIVAKSVTPARIKENTSVFDFTLSDEDMNRIYGLDQGYRACPGKIWSHSPYFPFHEEF